jgi:hypothetical protein
MIIPSSVARPFPTPSLYDQASPNQDEVPAPVAPDEADQQPEHLVGGTQPRALARGTRQGGGLLTEEEVLGDQVPAVADGRVEQGSEEEQALDHRGQ